MSKPESQRNIIEVAGSSLRGDKSKLSCGCIKRPKSTKEDLINKRFGNCTVIENYENSPCGARRVKCICDCGEEFIAFASKLKINQTSSCKKCVIESRINDITGQTFGRLKVLEKTDTRNNQGKILWKCQCQCDKNTIVYLTSGALTSGNTKSCGCYNYELITSKHKNNKYDLDNYEYGVGYCEDGYEYYFDKEDYDLIKDYYWNHTNDGYIVTKRNINNVSTTICMHRLILNVTDDRQVDHIKHNVNDNRKSELRICTLGQNNLNTSLFKNNSSGVTGVAYDKKKKNKNWYATITYNNQNVWLGYYDTKEEAINARREAEDKYFGEYSYYNSIKLNTIN